VLITGETFKSIFELPILGSSITLFPFLEVGEEDDSIINRFLVIFFCIFGELEVLVFFFFEEDEEDT
jgi:hypothetical protein